MTMDFKAANSGLLADLKPGSGIAFEFVERAPGEWVITKIVPRGKSIDAESKPGTHQGH